MNFLTQAWNWFNGNKTVFGMVLLLFAQQGILPGDSTAQQVILWLGSILTGVGMTHKLKKANTKAEPNK